MRLASQAVLLAALLLGGGVQLASAQQPAPQGQRTRNVEVVGQFGGALSGVAVGERYAYVGAGPRLLALDVANPAAPELVGQSPPLPGLVQRVVVAPPYAYVSAGNAGMRILDVARPTSPVEVGAYHAPEAIRWLAVAGRYAYVTGIGGLRIVDVSEPRRPREVGAYARPSLGALAVAGVYAYVTDGSAMRVLDVSNPSAITEAGSYAAAGPTVFVAASGAFVYLQWRSPASARFGGLDVLDVSAPARPTRAGTTGTDLASDMALAGRYVYVAEVPAFNAIRPGGLRVIDISDPHHPADAGAYEAPRSPVGVAGTERAAYLLDQTSLRVFDLAGQAAPAASVAPAGTFNAPAPGRASAVAVAGTRAYVGALPVGFGAGQAGGGLRVLDVSDPARPTAAGAADPGAPAGWAPARMALAGNYAYIAGGPRVHIVDVSDPSKPVPAGAYDTPPSALGIAVAGSYAYVGVLDRLLVLDVADPAHPAEVGAVVLGTGGGGRDVALAGKYAHVTGGGVLSVVDVADPAAPSVVGAFTYFPAGGGPSAVVAAGPLVYVAEGFVRLHVLDVADEANPVEVGMLQLPGTVEGVALDGTTLYVAARAAGLRVVDVSDARRPNERGFFITPDDALRLAITGGTAYVAAGASGLFVLRFSDAPRDARYFLETQHRVSHDPFWAYFTSMGGVATFGFPVSRTFTLLGCTTQVFQRQLLQQCGAGAVVQTVNLLDPELMPYHQINFSTFPAHDPDVAQRAPPPGTPDYGEAVLRHARATAPEEFQGLPVRFYSAFVGAVPAVDAATDADLAALVNLEIWGFPTSRPQFDPANRGFVYQRYQRGIMHFRAATGTTEGILVADYFKSLVTGRDMPADLAAQAAGSRFLRQYCPDRPRALCRPDELPATDLTLAFEPQ